MLKWYNNGMPKFDINCRNGLAAWGGVEILKLKEILIFVLPVCG